MGHATTKVYKPKSVAKRVKGGKVVRFDTDGKSPRAKTRLAFDRTSGTSFDNAKKQRMQGS